MTLEEIRDGLDALAWDLNTSLIVDYVKAIDEHIAERQSQPVRGGGVSEDVASQLAEDGGAIFNRAEVIEAWQCLRKNNCSIPDECLDDMRRVLLDAALGAKK